MTAPTTAGLPSGERWQARPAIESVDQWSRRNVRGKGTMTRLRVVTDDGIERIVFHAQSSERHKPAGRRIPLTIGTSAPLSLGTAGPVMHFALRTMERGLDVLVIGPERADKDHAPTADDVEAVASRVSFPSTARAGHAIADHLAEEHGADLHHMLWTGVSLGAMKGIHFAALAPEAGREIVYGHFTVPVAPQPVRSPTAREMLGFMRGEIPAVGRMMREIVAKDLRDRTLRIHQNVARLSDPWLISKYVRATPLDREFRRFTKAWSENVMSGDVGPAALLLPADRLNTIEVFDGDMGGPPDEWREQLGEHLDRPTLHLMERQGRHTDAMRLSHQNRRAKLIWDVIGQLDRGVPVAELVHPLAA